MFKVIPFTGLPGPYTQKYAKQHHQQFLHWIGLHWIALDKRGGVMALKNFRCYQKSLEFYWSCVELDCVDHLREQLLRASSSITLNLAEGTAKPTMKDRSRYYFMALGSVRECEAIFALARLPNDSPLIKQIDELAKVVFQLCKSQNDGAPNARIPRSLTKPKLHSRPPSITAD
jgi:four helix bundle protein